MRTYPIGSARGRRAAFRLGAALLALLPAFSPGPAGASETVTYSYDARGRLIQVARSGSVNNGVVTTYAHDKANNRTTKTTTGSANPGPP